MPEDLCPLKLQQLFQGKKINRRQFITQLTALGVGSALIPSFLAGSARASVPKKGGHFRMGMAGGSTSDSLDVAVLADVIEMSTNYALRNNLVEVDHNGRALPELAESWDVSAGAERWAFNLRRDVLFHNGKTMDARDVVYSIRHHMGKNSKSGAKGLVGQIASIEAQGKYQVVFTLASGNADFPYILNDY
ncbi:MAG: ABC transporter substrate-binding protein, partial [Desulfovibrionales bacterium]|nr:ABC transporter substrate-binding protein [Desulfovibrionales bacterium]